LGIYLGPGQRQTILVAATLQLLQTEAHEIGIGSRVGSYRRRVLGRGYHGHRWTRLRKCVLTIGDCSGPRRLIPRRGRDATAPFLRRTPLAQVDQLVVAFLVLVLVVALVVVLVVVLVSFLMVTVAFLVLVAAPPDAVPTAAAAATVGMARRVNRPRRSRFVAGQATVVVVGVVD
jgi:hypothetical protein